MIGIHSTDFPKEYSDQILYWQNRAQFIINDYATQKTSFLYGCLPNLAVQMPTTQIIYILTKRFGEEKVRQCLKPDYTFKSPISDEADSTWLKSVTMVGVNVRTIGSFWCLVKYALTLPRATSSIHLLPICECGEVARMASWHINREFFDYDLSVQFPHLNTIEKQLKVAVNLLHLMGKTVGFEVMPYTERYSEISLANPYHFGWFLRKNNKIVDYTDKLTDKVAQCIVDFVTINGSISADYFSRNYTDFFDDEKNSEEVRLRILFGNKENKETRNHRRNALISYLFEKGFEPMSVTIPPPYPSLIVATSDSTKTVDTEGRIRRDHIIEKPNGMPRAFEPLVRYKLYESKDDNINWEVNFAKPKANVFEYVAKNYLNICLNYNFDFMLGDVSQIQMNQEITDNQADVYYDIYKFVKKYIKKSKPSFAYFAESFLGADNMMANGNEANYLNYSDTDSTLGNLQSYAMSQIEFYNEFHRYCKLAQSNSFSPNFTVFTADNDEPAFDPCYWDGNIARYFIGMFFKYLPSYNSLGFELRDSHNVPAPNEYYTKLFAFQLDGDPNSTKRTYQWGRNGLQFSEIQAINHFADQIFIEGAKPIFKQVSDIDQFANDKMLVWSLEIDESKYLFIVNLFSENKIKTYDLPKTDKLKLLYKYNCDFNDLHTTLTLQSYSQVIFKYTN